MPRSSHVPILNIVLPEMCPEHHPIFIYSVDLNEIARDASEVEADTDAWTRS